MSDKEWWEPSAPREAGQEMLNISSLPAEMKRDAWEKIKARPDLLETFEILLRVSTYFGGEIEMEKRDFTLDAGRRRMS
jgi:hypothetical protein|tara:strand:- start:87 stop:323 length:237 start_codon:yes stop_codon:yes gene_type:complete